MHPVQNLGQNLELGQSMPRYAPRRAFGLKLADTDQEINFIIKFFLRPMKSPYSVEGGGGSY